MQYRETAIPRELMGQDIVYDDTQDAFAQGVYRGMSDLARIAVVGGVAIMVAALVLREKNVRRLIGKVF